MTTSKTTGAAQPNQAKTILMSLTPRQRRFLAMAQVVLQLYNRISMQIGEEKTAISATWRILLDSGEYAWFRHEYPEYPRSREQVLRIVRRQNAIQRRVETYGYFGSHEAGNA